MLDHGFKFVRVDLVDVDHFAGVGGFEGLLIYVDVAVGGRGIGDVHVEIYCFELS